MRTSIALAALRAFCSAITCRLTPSLWRTVKTIAPIMAVAGWVISPGVVPNQNTQIDTSITNTEALGHVLYTQYAYFFEGAGLVLLVAMIGAIVLTLRHKEGVKRQNPAVQSARTKAQSVEVVKVQTGQGI